MEYYWISAVGFWAALGILQAIALCIFVIWFVGKLVDWIWSLFETKSLVSQYTFTKLPEHIKDMKVSYDSKTNTITAEAYFLLDHEWILATHSVNVAYQLYEQYAQNAQLELMQKIKEEIDSWNKKLTTS